MGGRGGSSGINTISERISMKKEDLDYAIKKKYEYGTVPYGGTKKTRELFYEWSIAVNRLQKELSELEKKKRKKKNTSNNPLF